MAGLKGSLLAEGKREAEDDDEGLPEACRGGRGGGTLLAGEVASWAWLATRAWEAYFVIVLSLLPEKSDEIRSERL